MKRGRAGYPQLCVWVIFVCACVLPKADVHAAGLSRAMRGVAEQLGKSGDEAAAAVGTLVRRSADQSDDVLETIARKLGDNRAWSDLAGAMRKAGVRNAETLARQVDVSDETRKVLTWVFSSGGKAIDAAVKGGGTADGAVKNIFAGGPKAIDALTLIDDADDLRVCLEGFARNGEKFSDFVILGGEKAPGFWRRYGDEIAQAGDEAADDLLKNPAKYLDELGKPTPAFSERFLKNLPTARRPAAPRDRVANAWRRLGQATKGVGRSALWVIANPLTAIGWLFTGAWMTGTLGRLLNAMGIPPALVPTIQTILSLSILGLVVNLIAPWLFPVARWGVSRVLRFLARVCSGRAGATLDAWANRVPDWQSPIGVSFPNSNRLTIGIVGTKRVGKTTFIVMLAKHLANLVSRASLRPDRDSDRKKLDEISADVAQGRPTRIDKTINLDLTWPYVPGRKEGEGGTTNKLLVLTDFPGEWAAADADGDSRKKLLSHLRGVDGLMVVIDPTTLEGDSVRFQLDSVERLFMREGVDLGRRFKRALAIVVTKRDAITPELVSRVRRPGRGKAVDEERIFALSARPYLSDEESRELGRLMLELLAPSIYESIGGRLEREEAEASPSTTRFIPRRTSRPQLAAFAISQLGRSLGSQVVSYRERYSQWEQSGRRGSAPSVSLDLDGADPKELEVHYPFRWLFDAIPEGLLHQTNAMVGFPAVRLRWNVHRRFKGSPVVAADRVVGYRRAIAGSAVVAVAVLLFPVIVGSLNRRMARREVGALRNRMLSSALDSSDIRAVRDSLLPSQPNPELVAALTRFEHLAEGESKAAGGTLNSPTRSLDKTFRATQELGLIASWKREPAWKNEYDLVDASVGRLEKQVLSSLVEETEEAVTLLERRGSFNEAIDLVDRSRSVVPYGVSPALTSETQSRLDRNRQRLEGARAQRDLDEAEERLKTLAGIDAIRCVDQVIVPASSAPAVHARHEELRRRIVDEFWQQAKTSAATLSDAGQVTEATDVIDRFLAVPSPNHHASQALEIKSALKGNFVKAAVEQARGLLQNDETDQAWAILDRSRAYRDAADQTMRLAWWDIAVEVKLRQRDFAGAVTLLTQPEPGDERKLQDTMQRVVVEWHDALLTTTDSLIAEQKFDDANEGLAQFLDVAGRHAEPAIRDGIMQRLKDLGQQRLRDNLRILESQLTDNANAAFTRLDGLGSRVVAGDDLELQSDWVRLLIDSGRKADRFADALRSLDRLLPQESLERKSLDERWSELGEIQVKRAENAIANERHEDGWKVFRIALDEPSTPAQYRHLVTTAAETAWQRRLRAVRSKVEAQCVEKRFAEAKGSINSAREEVAMLLETSLPTSHDLTILEKELTARELTQQVDEACDTGSEQSAEACERALERIGGVLAAPTLSDKDRARVDAAKRRLLNHWEELAYRKLHKLYSDYDFPALENAVHDYLSPKTMFGESIDGGRRERVEELQRWFNAFDAPRDYTITAVGVSGVPAGGWWFFGQQFDPAFRLSALRPGDQAVASVVEGQKDSIKGDGDIPPHGKSGALRWTRGDVLTIDLWEDSVEHDGWRYGRVNATSQYALPSLVYRPFPLDASNGDVKSWDFSKVTVQLRVKDWPVLPQLPQP